MSIAQGLLSSKKLNEDFIDKFFLLVSKIGFDLVNEDPTKLFNFLSKYFNVQLIKVHAPNTGRQSTAKYYVSNKTIEINLPRNTTPPDKSTVIKYNIEILASLMHELAHHRQILSDPVKFSDKNYKTLDKLIILVNDILEYIVQNAEFSPFLFSIAFELTYKGFSIIEAVEKCKKIAEDAFKASKNNLLFDDIQFIKNTLDLIFKFQNYDESDTSMFLFMYTLLEYSNKLPYNPSKNNEVKDQQLVKYNLKRVKTLVHRINNNHGRVSAYLKKIGFSGAVTPNPYNRLLYGECYWY